MRKAYLFMYDGNVGTREEMKNVLNSMDRVLTWRFDIPNCFYVISECSAQELYDEFISHNGTKGRFMFIEPTSNSQGQMLPDTWYLLTHKTHKPKS
ncbi:hypothetical protein A3754_08450 [Alcanivorax sp. HI0083]|uniref:hypothetical protein n=1 Tax=unclassified Alcanivorax TaxID=2638842 RepID=UPI0007BAA05A|nr:MULTISPECIES: hypothetical protein [unclassified Alcanivorax]KZY33596.1 hypothetical protein A3730_03865 [Alcanivorax sp. HI0044]KZZ27211.1 hypothetical protein A3754_08450 [Alcanivorax sp. HI0083]